MSKTSKYLVLLRREFWESPSLWRVPVAAAGLLMIGALLGISQLVKGISLRLFIPTRGVDVTIESGASSVMSRAAGAQMMMGITGFISMFAAAVVAIYLLDSLYGERKDRSILFWKSLPVSDTQTVVSKLIVAMVVVPLLVLALAALLLPLITGLGALVIPGARSQLGWLIVGGLGGLPRLFGTGTIVVLWYAPVAVYLMLASVAARRSPLIYAALPPLALALGERMLLGSTHVLRFLTARLLPVPQYVPGDSGAARGWLSLATDWWKMLTVPELWLGVIAAAVMLYAVIRLRRYRDDT